MNLEVGFHFPCSGLSPWFKSALIQHVQGVPCTVSALLLRSWIEAGFRTGLGITIKFFWGTLEHVGFCIMKIPPSHRLLFSALIRWEAHNLHDQTVLKGFAHLPGVAWICVSASLVWRLIYLWVQKCSTACSLDRNLKPIGWNSYFNFIAY